MLLSVQSISKHFGGLQALDNVSFEVPQGCIFGLIGPNGSGKTTLLNVISGLLRASGGRVVFDGREITSLPPHEIASLGIGRTFQNLRLFPEASVLDNILLGCYSRQRSDLLGTVLMLPSHRREEKSMRAQSQKLAEDLGLGAHLGEPAGELSYGAQRRVEIVRVLALRPKLVLLDEPTAGMNAAEGKVIGTVLQLLKSHGYTVIIVEHNVSLLFAHCDEVVVLNFGRKIAQGSPETVRNEPEVIKAYLGEHHA